jgi:DNA-binding HxlR family transcriptional regulator
MRQLRRPITKSEIASVACDYWSFHILDEIDAGLVRYERLMATLPIARNILANRLADLRRLDLIERDKCSGDRRCFNYRITERGRQLLPVISALREWEGWDGRLSEFCTNDQADQPSNRELANEVIIE